MKSCAYCGKDLSKYRRKYCSDECLLKYYQEFKYPLYWSNAVAIAKRRTGGRCENCGNKGTEVHHIALLDDGESRWNGPKNDQKNLKVLCRDCHENAHHPKKQACLPKEQLAFSI